MKRVVTLMILVFACSFARADGSADGAPSAGSAAVPTPTDNPGNKSLRKICTDAMNADPAFAKAIVEVADKEAAERRLDADEAAHVDAAAHIAKDQKHVILAYAAMWIIAAGFVVFLWRRQQALKGEIAQLKRDLDAELKATKSEPKS
jgi:hypothetical protein